MSAQDVILGARVAHVRELKTEIERLKAENTRLRDENTSLRSHFGLALLAAQDLRGLSPEGKFILVDGWNLILGAKKEAFSPDDLVAKARRHLGDRPLDFVWIIFDGPKENSFNEDRLRVSYTGGTGPHRADKMITDFVRMARYLGLHRQIEVRTHDKDFLADVRRFLS